MNVSFENADKINGVLTITVEKDDYQPQVDKALKEYRKRANVPGFRKGMVPMGMVKRMYGTQAKADAVDRLVSHNLTKYIQDNKIQMLGQALPNEKQQQQDMESDGPFEFIFDIAVAPEFKIELGEKDKINHYSIKVDDKLIDDQVDMFRSRTGHYDNVDTFDATTNDMIKGDIKEVDGKGATKEGGIEADGVSLMPQYIKVEEQKKLFEGAKTGDTIVFNPKKAYPESDAEVSSLLRIDKEKAADVASDFALTINSISRYIKGEINQELFDSVYGEGSVKDIAEFRQKISDGLKTQFSQQEDFKFLLDLREYCEKKVGELKFPVDLLKRIMQSEKSAEEVTSEAMEKNIRELKWYLIRHQLVEANEIKVETEDIKSVAKENMQAMFAQYGMSQVPEDMLERYVANQLKNQKEVERYYESAVDIKLTSKLKKVVKLNEKEVTLEEFNKLMQKK